VIKDVLSRTREDEGEDKEELARRYKDATIDDLLDSSYDKED
jgi:hypothetical protein